jgi:glycosyltransferase involved in cell wall biosynthesis
MRVLMVISQFHPMIGGAEKQAQLLARKLVELGIQVRIVTGRWKFGTLRRDRIDGIDVFRNFCCWGMFGVKGIRPLGAFIYMVTLSAYLLIHRREYDIIHVHQALYPAFVSVWVGNGILGKPVIVKTASSGMTSDIRQLKRFPLGRLQLGYLLKKMNCLVAVSKVSGREFIDVGYPESRILYIPNGVAVPAQERRDYGQVRYVLTTSRLSREKGVDVLLKAWAKVLQREQNLKLLILGDGPLASELFELSQSLGSASSVKFNGFVHTVPEHLRASDLFVLPSRTEGMSNALLEAMGYGIPCVATFVGGNDEVVKPNVSEISTGKYVIGENGLLVNSDDVEALSEAILYLVRNGAARERLGKRGRLFVQKYYSIESIADRYIQLYREFLNKKPRDMFSSW